MPRPAWRNVRPISAEGASAASARERETSAAKDPGSLRHALYTPLPSLSLADMPRGGKAAALTAPCSGGLRARGNWIYKYKYLRPERIETHTRAYTWQLMRRPCAFDRSILRGAQTRKFARGHAHGRADKQGRAAGGSKCAPALLWRVFIILG